ncbi:MAG: alpha/beta hydrolase [Kiritimatiellae bacterium]|nr:alpha/beta hydrolase [Kiritimatiellia bacterium]
MISHGLKDAVIPGWQSKRLYARANSPKLFREVSNAGHNDLYPADETGFWESWDAFIKLIASQKAAPK